MKQLNYNRELPAWCLPLIAIIAVLFFCIMGWRSYTQVSDTGRPAIAVHPGMYDLRAEIAKHAGNSPANHDTH